jgi:unsaturated chondroitin disaccharide hydrolase
VATAPAVRVALAFALRQLRRTVDAQPAGRYPFVAVGDRPWLTTDASNWTAGFFPGQLWLAYDATGDKAWARLARARQRDLVARQHDTSTHDLGFVMYDSFGQQFRLTGDPGARSVLLNSARSLASRWVPVARTLRSWNGPRGEVTVIVDNMVNLELLFWGARHGGPARWRRIALEHALTTRNQLVRPDGSTLGAVRFSEQTGNRVWRGNIGGWRHDSTWARGQAWAVYGYTMAYRETHDPRMLEVARRTAGFALRHLPGDGVPYWDYDVPVTRSTPRDSSAAAVLSSAFLELARIDPVAGRRATYRAAGLRSLRTLAGPRYLAQGSGARSVLVHAHNDPAHPDVGVPYGDYYFLEALLRSHLLPAR